MKVLAAMSGGVDSAVAAARAVDAGHDVVGVHLALSRMPGTLRTGSRGCCTIEDASDAWRACERLGISFYTWDFSERFAEDVVDDFVAEYEAGRTPNPCMRCNERIKFAALLERALELGFDAVCTGHYAAVRPGPDGSLELHRAADDAKDQSYVLGVLTAVPLILFSAAARSLTLTTLGMLQYTAPILQFLVAVTVLGEQMPAARWAGFGLIWLSLAVFTLDQLNASRLQRRAVRAGQGAHA